MLKKLGHLCSLLDFAVDIPVLSFKMLPSVSFISYRWAVISRGLIRSGSVFFPPKHAIAVDIYLHQEARDACLFPLPRHFIRHCRDVLF